MNIKQTLSTILLSSAIAVGAQGASVTGKTTIVATDNAPTVLRVEAFTALPYGIDAFLVAQQQGEKELLKIRAQAVHMEGNYGAGIVYQHTEAGTKDAHVGLDSIGVMARVASAKGKIDLRYFPKQDLLDFTALAKHDKIYRESFGSYNTETGKGSAISGIFYDLHKGKHHSISAGIETKISIASGDLKADYTGIGVKMSFKK